MKIVNYSEKEVIIFNGLIKLIKEGLNPYSIRVSDIAKSADVGKGTIYDYFDSKEEAISKAILYYITSEIEDAYISIVSKETFEEKYYQLLQIIKENFENNVSLYNILLTSGGMENFYEHLSEVESYSRNLKDSLGEVLDNILSAGFTEGILSKDHESSYQSIAIRSAIFAFSHCISKKTGLTQLDFQEAMDVSFNILIKTLN